MVRRRASALWAEKAMEVQSLRTRAVFASACTGIGIKAQKEHAQQ
jgi:hypothetical protein